MLPSVFGSFSSFPCAPSVFSLSVCSSSAQNSPVLVRHSRKSNKLDVLGWISICSLFIPSFPTSRIQMYVLKSSGFSYLPSQFPYCCRQFSLFRDRERADVEVRSLSISLFCFLTSKILLWLSLHSSSFCPCYFTPYFFSWGWFFWSRLWSVFLDCFLIWSNCIPLLIFVDLYAVCLWPALWD